MPAARRRGSSSAWSTITLIAVLAMPASAQENLCEKCHPNVAAEASGRVHQRIGVGCVDCHGGDSSAETREAAHAETAGYRGVPPRTEWPGLCGNCHADVERMNPFGIRTDQLKRYRTSRHGHALLEEHELRAATCVDCHGAHGIRDARDAESSIYPQNVPATCAKCHDDPDMVEEFGFDGDELEAYRASVHGRLLLEEGDLSAPQCATCHGNHAAVPPGVETVRDVCGKCHIRERDQFLSSPHAPLVETGEFDSCIVCHGNHRIEEANEGILQRLCGLCHSPGERAMEIRDRLLADLKKVEANFGATGDRLDAALAEGLATGEDRLLLEKARTAMVQMSSVQHSLDPEVLDGQRDEAIATLGRLNELIESRRREERRKRLSLLAVVAFLCLMSFGFYLRFRRIHRETRSIPDE